MSYISADMPGAWRFKVYGDNFEELPYVQWANERIQAYCRYVTRDGKPVLNQFNGDVLTEIIFVKRLRINWHAKCVFILHGAKHVPHVQV